MGNLLRARPLSLSGKGQAKRPMYIRTSPFSLCFSLLPFPINPFLDLYTILIQSQRSLDTTCSKGLKTTHPSTSASGPRRLRIESISSIPALSLSYEYFYSWSIIPTLRRVSATAGFYGPYTTAVVIVENGGHSDEGD